MLSGGPHFSPFSIHLFCPPFVPCGRSELLRRNNDHPSRNRREGRRLHHLPLPQRGLVEAGAVRPPGVPQRPDAVLDGHHRGRRKSSAEGLVLYDWQAGAQFLSNLRQMMTLEGRTLNLVPGCNCAPGVTACFQTLPDLLCSHPRFYTLPWTLSFNHNGSPTVYFLYMHPLSACCGHLSQKKKRTVSTLNGTFFSLQGNTLRACLHNAHNRIHACVLILLLWQEFQFHKLRSNPKITRLSMDAGCFRCRKCRLIYDFVKM